MYSSVPCSYGWRRHVTLNPGASFRSLDSNAGNKRYSGRRSTTNVRRIAPPHLQNGDKGRCKSLADEETERKMHQTAKVKPEGSGGIPPLENRVCLARPPPPPPESDDSDIEAEGNNSGQNRVEIVEVSDDESQKRKNFRKRNQTKCSASNQDSKKACLEVSTESVIQDLTIKPEMTLENCTPLPLSKPEVLPVMLSIHQAQVMNVTHYGIELKLDESSQLCFCHISQ